MSTNEVQVKTPKHWQNMECVEQTTAYGHKVMVPKRFSESWEIERETYEKAKALGLDLSIGVEEYNHTETVHHERRNSLMVFYEKYQREE